MNKSIFELFKLGRKFVGYWPQRAELFHYFSEYRQVEVTRFVCRVLPFSSFVVFALQLGSGGAAIVPMAFAVFILINSLPVHAMLLMGKKSQESLPPSLASWYREGVEKLKANGSDVKLSASKPKYMDLARLLDITYKNKF